MIRMNKIIVTLLIAVFLVLSVTLVGADTSTSEIVSNFTLQPEQPAYPAISDLTNSTVTYTSALITWSTNQSTSNNRVKYSELSNLSSATWSDWDNGTSDVSIEITGLTQNTTYYYQAWSYNHINESYNTSEPTTSPYLNFTTLKVPHGLALTNAINTNDTVGVSASYSDNIVTITADETGEGGNNITTTETVTNAAFDSATLTGGGTSESPWASYTSYGIETWTAIGGLIVLVVIVTLLSLVITGVINIEGEGISISVLVSAGVAISALVILFTIVPFIGYSIDSTVSLTQDTAASGTLTFTGDAADGETVTISDGVQTDVYEFDTDDNITGGNIVVEI